MTSPYLHRVAVISALLFLISGPVRAADTSSASAGGNTGDLWEVTSQMSMAGMKGMEGMPMGGMAMPAQTNKVCARRGESPAPADERQNCQNSDFKRVGPKATWKVHCSNPEMTGEGAITYNGASAYAGTVKFMSAQGGMTIKLNGKRAGACTPPG